MTDPTYNYPGQELCLFANAKNWKSYFCSRTIKFVTGDILEVGAGLEKQPISYIIVELRMDLVGTGRVNVQLPSKKRK